MIALALLLVARQGSGFSINFDLTHAADSSCGIFTETGRLVRTLWGNRELKPKNYTAIWDGKDDLGNPPPPGPYVARLLLHNFSVHWAGVIGNSSRYFTATSKLRGLGAFADLLFAGNAGYLLRKYNEAGEYVDRFPLARPDVFSPVGAKNNDFRFVPKCFATDGARLYVGATPNPQNGAIHSSGVYALTLGAPGPNLRFTGLAPVAGLGKGGNDGGRFLPTGSGYGAEEAVPTAIAVQAHGAMLAVAMQREDRILFFDKATGRSVAPDLDVKNVGPIQFSPDGGTLWVGAGQTVRAYSLRNGNWRAGPQFGDAAVRAIAVDPKDGAVAALFGGKSPHVECVDPETCAVRWTVGSKESYAQNPMVTDDKFMLLPPDPAHQPVTGGLAFDPYGGLWVVDEGNQRVLRFAHPVSQPSEADKTICMLTGYTLAVDRNDPTRVFHGYLEFRRDWDQPLRPGMNGGWKLVRNWGAGRLDVSLSKSPADGLTQVVTHAGHTYGILCPGSEPNKKYFAELAPDGLHTLRAFDDNSLDSDLNAWLLTRNLADHRVVFARRPLVSLDDARPIWGDAETFCSVPDAPGDPVYDGGYSLSGGMPVQQTADGQIASFNTNVPGRIGDYYLGLTRRGERDFTARTAIGDLGLPLTHDGRLPVGPPDPHEIPSIGGLVYDDLIALFANGEGFDQGEADQILFYHSSGLPLVDFGTRGAVGDGLQAPGSGRSGNFYGAAFFRTQNGALHVLHTDESVHGGIHELDIEGENTIKVFSAPFAGRTASFGEVAPRPGGVVPAPVAEPETLRADWGGSLDGWTDSAHMFRTGAGELRVDRHAFGAWDRALLLRSTKALDTDLTVDIPAQTFDRSRMYVDPNGWEGDWELVSRVQPDGDRYFLQLKYFRPLHPGSLQAGGVLSLQIGLVVGGLRYGLAFDRAMELPIAQHGYRLSFSVHGSNRAMLHGEVTDAMTGKRLMVLDQLSDQPELQSAGRFGLCGGMGNNAFGAFTAHFGG